MKLISLNIWGGRVGDKRLKEFFRTYEDVDVFCLQEVYAAAQQDYLNHQGTGAAKVIWKSRQLIEEALPGHRSYFHSQYLNDYGLQLLIKRGLKVDAAGDVFVYQNGRFIPTDDIGRRARNIQYVTVATNNGPLTIANFHGLWNGQGKGDSQDRIGQSARIVNFLKTIEHPVVMLGDFNLLPDTASMDMIEKAGLRNLIKDFGITSTRTSLYTKPVKYADYALVDPSIDVVDFRVLPDEVSDHSALYLEISGFTGETPKKKLHHR